MCMLESPITKRGQPMEAFLSDPRIFIVYAAVPVTAETGFVEVRNIKTRNPKYQSEEGLIT